MPKALLIDDDLDTSHLLMHELEEEGFQAFHAKSGAEAISTLGKSAFDLLLLDLFLGEEQGLDLMPQLLSVAPNIKIWVLTAKGSIESAVEAMKRGANGFFLKAEGAQKIREELRAIFFREPLTPLAASSFGLIGKSERFNRILSQISTMKSVDSTVLITGESGTGKELIARALHQASPRRDHPFEAINCAAIPENLLESELFGYKRGAFTDAKADKKGLFEHCSEGVLLLDEIGDMPLSLQVKLLRVLQEREIRPIGAYESIPIRTRVIASTNKLLEEEVKKGRFREDLFYRVSVLRIESPSLRQKKEDIPLLIESFLSRFNQRFNKTVRNPNCEVMARLLSYDWPGNVRELQNMIERGVVLSQDNELHLENLFEPSMFKEKNTLETDPYHSVGLSLSQARQNFERVYLRRVLALANGNISRAARIAKEHRPRLYRLLKKYHLDPAHFKPTNLQKN